MLGTPEERGIAAWQVSEEDESKPVDRSMYNEGYDVYYPLIPKRLMYSKIMKYVPFIPYKRKAVEIASGGAKIA